MFITAREARGLAPYSEADLFGFLSSAIEHGISLAAKRGEGSLMLRETLVLALGREGAERAINSMWSKDSGRHIAWARAKVVLTTAGFVVGTSYDCNDDERDIVVRWDKKGGA